MKSADARLVDVALIGAGIMSTTLATLLRALDPKLTIAILERLEAPALESSDGWNNAGTGHAANCEMNYTPEKADGSVDISKALDVNVQFDLSRQLWSHLVETGDIPDPSAFIRACPHCAFVVGQDNMAFLKKRHAAMSAHHCFAGMEYSEDPGVIAGWAPLVMTGRDPAAPVAATRMVTGTDVDYGTLTRLLFDALQAKPGFHDLFGAEVDALSRKPDGRWHIGYRAHGKGAASGTLDARFVFIGAGGASLSLLQKSGIPEGHGYGGFPISGIWLRCDRPEIVERHKVKVYGKAAHGSPPMSVPHLDARVVDGRHSILFGPYAGFSPKFLKQGSWFDLPLSLRWGNLGPMIDVGIHSFGLEEYLADQLILTESSRFETLKQFFPDAREEDWHEAVAGQRVQIIRPTGNGGGTLDFGTALVGASDRSLIALMGASPGASTAAAIALETLHRCFPERLVESDWLPALRKIVPTYGIDLKQDAQACRVSRDRTARILQTATIDGG
ncbi:malate dehydrogenase (quinone) [Sphingomonas sp. BE138]|uniref:malate dehydrogenase (quinone) n=1 Tax=Sphingomonas sp. BE138 TaxID=2817845 RepID=UPI00286A20CF|nr:malate dehydrogenase (quinone) [Sphingomonas sp. BE138]